MTGLRRAALVVGLAAVAAMAAFPPWLVAPEYNPAAASLAGYHFILRGPPESRYAYLRGLAHIARIDYARLFTQWAVVAALVGAVMLVSARRTGSSP